MFFISVTIIFLLFTIIRKHGSHTFLRHWKNNRIKQEQPTFCLLRIKDYLSAIKRRL